MKVKIEYLKAIKKRVEIQTKTIETTLDNFWDVCADEDEIKEVVESLRYLADLIESIPIA